MTDADPTRSGENALGEEAHKVLDQMAPAEFDVHVWTDGPTPGRLDSADQLRLVIRVLAVMHNMRPEETDSCAQCGGWGWVRKGDLLNNLARNLQDVASIPDRNERMNTLAQAASSAAGRRLPLSVRYAAAEAADSVIRDHLKEPHSGSDGAGGQADDDPPATVSP